MSKEYETCYYPTLWKDVHVLYVCLLLYGNVKKKVKAIDVFERKIIRLWVYYTASAQT